MALVATVTLAVAGWSDEKKEDEPVKGQTVILGTWTWDIETNKQGGDVKGVDVRWEQATATEQYLVPLNGAGLIVFDKKKEFEKITREDLAELKYSDEKLANDALAPGTVVALRTNEGNFAKLKVVKYRELHDFSFPEAKLLNEAMKEFMLKSPNTKKYHIEVEWVLYRKAPPAKSPSAEDQKGKLPALLTERRDALTQAFEGRWGRVKLGLEAPNADLLEVSLLSLQADLELIDNSNDRIAAREKHVKSAKEIDDIIKFQAKVGKLRGDVYPQVHAARLAAEIELLREKAGGKPNEEQMGEIKKLLEARCDALREEVETKESLIKAGLEFPNVDLLGAASRLLQARLDLTKEPKDRNAAHDKYISVTKKVDEEFEGQFKSGKVRSDLCAQIHAARLAAEIALLREQAGSKPSADQTAAITKLLKARRDTLRAEVEAREKRVNDGFDVPNVYLMDASRRLLKAELELTEKRDDRVDLHQKYVEIAKKTEEILKGAAKIKRIRDEPYLEAKAARLEAEIALLREQMK
jgi:hypothetical protein